MAVLLGGPILGSLYEGSSCLGSILGVLSFLETPIWNPWEVKLGGQLEASG